MPAVITYSIGFLAQAFFSARILVQWILSERTKKVVSPVIYWVLSLAGALLLFIYGWIRHDFSIILGQFLSFYIYIWNLNSKGVWNKIPSLIRSVIILLPVAAIIYSLRDAEGFVMNFFKNEKIPLWLLLFGSAGQIIFTLRFVYQWFYSFKRKESILPVGFWTISLIGSGIIVSYGCFRSDPVLILGQSVGFIAYIRNIVLNNKSKKE